ncbi:unnamed protein product [Protopolystoma xenopodis]|uniref:Uncharacterized protein n=1 Tax=Protopolystoma xenopodis TaxID=117903 RepID=A0A3S5AGV4_9PLAT|nr:unnamed protein product [Protopolystoma xenopodis]
MREVPAGSGRKHLKGTVRIGSGQSCRFDRLPNCTIRPDRPHFESVVGNICPCTRTQLGIGSGRAKRSRRDVVPDGHARKDDRKPALTARQESTCRG